MDYASTRSFTMMLAHRAVGDIRRDGFRQLRNYVDMCATLSKRPQQKDFFEYAQKALQRTDSCYYMMIHSLLDKVEEDRICTVGVNMGYGSLIYGASKMKKQAETDGAPCAWIAAAQCGDPALDAQVQKAEKAGCFVWVLDATACDPAAAATLAKAHPQAAFGVLVDPAALTTACLDALAPCMNVAVLPLLSSPELTPECCCAVSEMKKRKMLYMLTVQINADTVDIAMQPDWLASLSQETLFCMYALDSTVDPDKAHRLYREIVDGRMESGRTVLLLDWNGDIRYLNRRISEHAVVGNALPAGAAFPLELDLQ